jgi:DNA phosphorothioation-dependent restriction protein DptG
MASYIETKEGQAWIASPINPGENFADKWKDAPKKKEAFYTWLKAAQAEFSNLESKGSIVQLSEGLKKSIGENVVNAAYSSYQIKNSKRNALKAAVSAVKTPTAPHAK